jgi:hypothetical protein
MIMVDPEGKQAIFNQWSEACRWAGDGCNVQLNSVKKTIQTIDEIADGLNKLNKGK